MIALAPASATRNLASSSAHHPGGGGSQSQPAAPAADPAAAAARARNLRDLHTLLGSVSGSFREVGSAAAAASLFGLKDTAPAASNVTLTIGSRARIEVRWGAQTCRRGTLERRARACMHALCVADVAGVQLLQCGCVDAAPACCPCRCRCIRRLPRRRCRRSACITRRRCPQQVRLHVRAQRRLACPCCRPEPRQPARQHAHPVCRSRRRLRRCCR